MKRNTETSYSKEKKYAWDNEQSREVLILRRMMYDDPEGVFREYDKNLLKKIFIEQWFKMDKRNRAFWKLILEVDEDEFDKYKKELRDSIKIWDF